MKLNKLAKLNGDWDSNINIHICGQAGVELAEGSVAEMCLLYGKCKVTRFANWQVVLEGPEIAMLERQKLIELAESVDPPENRYLMLFGD